MASSPIVGRRRDLVAPGSQKHHRLRVQADVEITADLVTERGRSHDVSASGMFVDAAQEYETGMVVRLRFHVDRRDFDTHARIVHVKPQIGFGAMFLDLDPEARRHLLRFVHRERARREAERLLGQR